MSTGETKSGPSGLAKGFLGAALVAIAGFVGTAAMNVLSAPKDSVAYDLVQSMTGMLKGAPPTPPAEPPAKVAATSAQPLSAMPKAPEPAGSPQATAEAAPPPKPPAPVASAPAAAETQPAPAVPVAPSPDASPAGTMADRLRQTTALADKARAATAALSATRVLSLNDRAEAPICGATYQLEVTSVTSGRGEVALRAQEAGAAPVTLTVGKPRNVRAGCRVELLGAMDDTANRRAQLRETLIR